MALTHQTNTLPQLAQDLSQLFQDLHSAVSDSFDSLNLDQLQQSPFVQDDGSAEYTSAMEELQKQLEDLERKKREAAQKQEQKKQDEQRQREEQERQENQKNQENWWQKRGDEIVDDFQHPGDVPSNLGHDFDNAVTEIEEDEHDLQRYARKGADRSRQIWQKLLLLRWIINGWVVGFPFLCFLFIVWVWNLYVNVFWNKWWAEGNLFLMGNTLYIWTQSLVSLPLMFEVPWILRYIKPLRTLSLASAMIYNILFLSSVADFFYIALAEKKEDLENGGEIDMFLCLMIFYNLVENFPIVFINLGIMAKEFELPWFQLIGNVKAPSYQDKIQLSLFDIEETFIFLSHVFNPAWWGQQLFKDVAGYDPKDMIIENKNDEQHYYAGKAINAVEGEGKDVWGKIKRN